MKKIMKNKGRNRIRIYVLSLFFCLICSSFIIPYGYCSGDNPYCSGDDDKIEELVDDFTDKYGDGVKIYWDEDTDLPYIVSGMEMSASTEDPEETAFSFLAENASFFGLEVDDLKFKSTQENSSMKYVDFDQLYKDVPVQGGEIRVFIRITDGAVSSVNYRYLPCLDLDVVPDISAEEAAEVVKVDFGVGQLISVTTSFSEYGIAQKELSPVVPELIVYPKNRGEEVYLCWSFNFSTEMPYGPNGSWYYLIDAHTGDIISSGSLLMYGSENGNTSNSASSARNYSSNLPINNYNWIPSSIYNQSPYYNSNPYYIGNPSYNSNPYYIGNPSYNSNPYFNSNPYYNSNPSYNSNPYFNSNPYYNTLPNFYNNPYSTQFFQPQYNNLTFNNNSLFPQVNYPSSFSFLNNPPTLNNDLNQYFLNPFGPIGNLWNINPTLNYSLRGEIFHPTPSPGWPNIGYVTTPGGVIIQTPPL